MPDKQNKTRTGKGKMPSKQKTVRDLSVSESAVKDVKGGTFCKPTAAPSSQAAQQGAQQQGAQSSRSY